MKKLCFILSYCFLQPWIMAQENQATVTPLLNSPLGPEKNIIYTPAFRAAWTLLGEDILKEEVKLDEYTPLSEALNRVPYRIKNSGNWVAEAGFVGDGILQKISRSYTLKLGIPYRTSGTEHLPDDAIVCFAALKLDINFSNPFESMEWTFTSENSSERIACFGVGKSTGPDHRQAIRSQVEIYDYRNPDDFIIRLTGKEQGKEILIAETEWLGSPEKTYQNLMERMSGSIADPLSNQDELVLPKLRIQSEHSYGSLIRKHLANKGFEKYFFVRALDVLDFQLDETGASGHASGEIWLKKGPQPRIYAVDKPFLLVVRENGSSEPDLVCWIADTRFMFPVD